MQITDTQNNTRFLYAYVRDFKWMRTADNETNVGHPKVGNVYQVVENTDTKTYRLFYEVDGETSAIYLATLLAPDDGEPADYISDIVEITKKTIVDRRLPIAQLENIVKWCADDNASIRQMINLPNNEPKGTVNMTPDQVIDHIEARKQHKDFLELGNFLVQLSQADPFKYRALSEFAYTTLDHEDSVIDTSWPEFSKTLGAGRNISKAIDALARYGGDNRRTNLDEKDLYLAMNALLNELTRRLFHDY